MITLFSYSLQICSTNTTAPYTLHDGSCVLECPSTFYIFTNLGEKMCQFTKSQCFGYTVINDTTNTSKCNQDCPASYLVINGFCIQLLNNSCQQYFQINCKNDTTNNTQNHCQNGYNYTDKGICQLCQPDKGFNPVDQNCSIIVANQILLQNKMINTSCSFNYVAQELNGTAYKVCQSGCPSNLLFLDKNTNICVNDCQQFVMNISTIFNDYQSCQNTCKPNYIDGSNGKQCISTCAQYIRTKTNEELCNTLINCTKQVLVNDTLSTLTCYTQQCPQALTTLNNYCINQTCQDYYAINCNASNSTYGYCNLQYNYTNFCTICDIANKPFYNGSQCDLMCNQSISIVNQSLHCIPYDFKQYLFPQNLKINKTIIKFYTLVQTCQHIILKNNDGMNVCLQCQEPKPYIYNFECSDKCFTNFTYETSLVIDANFTCVDVCNYFYNISFNETKNILNYTLCAEFCQYNKSDNNNQCLLLCPENMQLINNECKLSVSKSTYYIIGGVIGAVILISIITGIALCVQSKKKQQIAKLKMQQFKKQINNKVQKNQPGQSYYQQYSIKSRDNLNSSNKNFQLILNNQKKQQQMMHLNKSTNPAYDTTQQVLTDQDEQKHIKQENYQKEILIRKNFQELMNKLKQNHFLK